MQKLRESYEYYYDIEDGDAGSGLPLEYRAEFRVRSEGYVLIKRAKIWAAETNEYAISFLCLFWTPTRRRSASITLWGTVSRG